MKYLLAASVGPVQTFIAAARKTRDLYAGSWVLSEVAKAAARNLADAGAELVFPWPGGDLTPRSEFTVSNKILAVVETESPDDLVAATQAAARLYLRRLCSELDKLKDSFQPDTDRLLEHVDEWLEFYSAWVPLTEEADYKLQYREVEALLGARKMTRAFPPHKGKPGLPKSSLDGMRESILPRPADRSKRESDLIRVDEDEELDGTGFLKRFVRLDHCRFESVKEIASRAGDDSYYGILMIDGDSMGNAISGLGKRGQQALSQRLSMFASGIRENLDRLSCMPVFAGGDELIAMIPLHRVVQTMEAVQNTFREIVCVDGANFTISAGLAIVHEMEPLDGARELAQKAKKSAKELTGKNALCITEAPRSGAAVSVAGRWDWMLPRLRKIVTAYAAKKLSYGFGHELWDVLHRTPNEIEEARPDLAMALAKHKRESNSAAAELVDANRDRLDDLMALMLVARKVARAGGAANL